MIERFDTRPELSQAVVFNGTIYLAGQVAQGHAGSPFAEQFQAILHRVDDLLALCGSDRTHMLNATIFLRSAEDYDAMNALWKAWLGAAPSPARSTICGIELALAGLDVEMTVVAGQGR